MSIKTIGIVGAAVALAGAAIAVPVILAVKNRKEVEELEKVQDALDEHLKALKEECSEDTE